MRYNLLYVLTEYVQILVLCYTGPSNKEGDRLQVFESRHRFLKQRPIYSLLPLRKRYVLDRTNLKLADEPANRHRCVR